MRKTLATILFPIAIITTLGFAIIVLNQTLQLVELADRIHPMFGTFVLCAIFGIFAICIFVPGYALLRLPKPLIPPSETAGPNHDRYMGELTKRLAGNPHLQPIPEAGLDLARAFTKLDKLAKKRTTEFAKKVFLGTAISQNGSVDALIVLAAQGRLIYEVATIYNQRPAIRDLVYLYTNVAATAFIAGEVDDIDVAEQIQPVVTAILGSSVAAIPGMSAAASLFVNSVVTGAGNAYLTLRVGILARQYCHPDTKSDRRSVRRSAAVEALPLLGGIVADGASSVASSIWAKPKKFFSDSIDSFLDKIKWPWRKLNASSD